MPIETSAEFESKYVSNWRIPAELYTIWNQYHTYYLTSSDQSIIYQTHTFEPARIKRQGTEKSIELSISKISVDVSYLNEEIIQYIGSAPLDQTWMKIEKVFLDQDPLESIIYFVGILDTVSFKGQSCNIEASGIEKLLRVGYPKKRYQPRCNHKLFSDQCGVDKNDYELTRTIASISTDGTEITVSNLTSYEENYFSLGYIQPNDSAPRMIVSSSGNVLTIRNSSIQLEVGDSILIYPGCNKSPTACQSKFANLGTLSKNNFLGFIYIPNDNPATWIS